MKKYIFGLLLCASLAFGGVAMAQTANTSSNNCAIAEAVILILNLNPEQASVVRSVLGCSGVADVGGTVSHPPISISSPTFGSQYKIGEGERIPINISVGSQKAGKLDLYFTMKQGGSVNSSSYMGSWNLNSGGMGSSAQIVLGPLGLGYPTGQGSAVITGYWKSNDGTEKTDGATSALFTLVDTTPSPSAPSITVTSPRAGETLIAGQSVTIKYTMRNFPPSPRVSLQLNKGATYPNGPFNPVATISSYQLATSQYSWTVPYALYGDDYSIMVSSDYPTTENGRRGYSDTFAIRPIGPITTPPPPTSSSVDLKINNTNGPLSVGSSGTLNLSWTSQGVNNCYTSGEVGNTNVWPWAARPASGSASVAVTPAMQGKTVEFAIRCGTGPSAGETQATDIVHVTVAAAPTPVVSADLKINGSDGTVNAQVGNTVQLTWTTAGVSSCHTSGDIGSTNVWPWALRNTNSNASLTITDAMKGKTVNVTLGCGSGPSATQTQVTDMVRVKVAH